MRRDQDGARRGRLFHPRRQVRRLADRRVIHVQGITDGADDDLAGVETHPDLNGHALGPLNLLGIVVHRILHLQGRITRPRCVVFVRQRRAEEGHDPVAHDIVHRALVPVNGFDHAFHHAFQELARLLGIAVGDELHGALEVGEQHGDLLALALDRAPRNQNLFREVLWDVGLRRAGLAADTGDNGVGTSVAELRRGGKRGTAVRARPSQRRRALLAEACPRRARMLAPGTGHAASISSAFNTTTAHRSVSFPACIKAFERRTGGRRLRRYLGREYEPPRSPQEPRNDRWCQPASAAELMAPRQGS